MIILLSHFSASIFAFALSTCRTDSLLFPSEAQDDVPTCKYPVKISDESAGHRLKSDAA